MLTFDILAFMLVFDFGDWQKEECYLKKKNLIWGWEIQVSDQYYIF